MLRLDRRVGRIADGQRRPRREVLICCFLLLVTVWVAGCGASGSNVSKSAVDRETALRQIAVEYGRTGDLAAANAALDRLNLANPAQLLVSLAEQAIAENRPVQEVEAMARLAEALGARSPKLIAYLAPTAIPTPSLPPPTVIPVRPTLPPTATAVPATSTPAPTPVPPTATASPTPQKPRVFAQGEANVRGGPGTGYPIVGRLQAGNEAEIVARNANGDWWRIAWPGAGQGWVAGLVVQVRGPIDTVPVAQDIPPLPPTATPAPPTATPKPAIPYIVKSVRLRSVGEDAQRCNAGENSIYVTVVDAAGNPLDNVRVREIYTGRIQITTAQGKGPGRVQYDIYRGGGGQVEIIDEAGNRISEVSRGMSADWPDFDLMKAAGYCACKPHPDDASCQADLASHNYLFAVGHYTYEVVFMRTW